MPTRPVQGGSTGTWGSELDAWLDVAHNADGTLILGYLPVFDVTKAPYNADKTGVADSSTGVQAAITAAYNASGGTVFFPAGTYRIDSQLTIPNDAHAPQPRQPAITLLGAGATTDGLFQTAGTIPTTTILDLRATTSPAKIDTRGLGTLTIRDLTMTQTSSAADTTAFVQTTNTTLYCHGVSFYGHSTLSRETCVQDAIVLGGTVIGYDGTANGAFGGYGTVIRECYFARIRRGVYGRTSANAVAIVCNTWSASCGSDVNGAAIHFDGTADQASGNYLAGNLIEVIGYSYGVRFTNSAFNVCVGNSFWDNDAGFVSAYLIEGVAAKCNGNSMRDAFPSPAFSQWVTVSTTAGTATYIVNGGTTQMGTTVFGGGDAKTIVQPAVATGSESAVLFTIKRSAAEGTNPGVAAFQVQQGGGVFIGAGTSTQGSLTITNTTNGNLAISNFEIVHSSGDLNIYPGSDQTYRKVKIARGLFGLPTFTTAGRPTAANATAGAVYYDTTVSKPVFSDGTTWRDAAGTAV